MSALSLRYVTPTVRLLVATLPAIAALVGPAPAAYAQPPAAGPQPPPAAARATQTGGDLKEPSTYDKIWKFAEWYSDESNPIVQKVLFSGRYQHEFAAIDSEAGNLDEWNVRRMRLGPR